MIVGVDMGHGARATGCVYGQLVERDYVEQVGELLQHHLESHSIEVVQTREVGENPWHTTRGRRTRGCDCVVSLHVNASVHPGQNGFEVYHWPNSTEGIALAAQIAIRCPDRLRPTDRRGSTEPRIWSCTDRPATTDDWLLRPRSVLRRHRPPAVLVEMGYASNDGDREYLLQRGTTDWLALSIASGICSWIAARQGRVTCPKKSKRK